MSNGDCGNCSGCACGGGKALLRAELRSFYETVSGFWIKETALPALQDRWSPEEPALGQSGVTALLVQDRFGGELIRTAIVGHGSHYHNRLANGQEVDLASEEYPDMTPAAAPEVRTREQMLGSPKGLQARTRERYELLKRAVEAVVGLILPFNGGEAAVQPKERVSEAVARINDAFSELAGVSAAEDQTARPDHLSMMAMGEWADGERPADWLDSQLAGPWKEHYDQCTKCRENVEFYRAARARRP